MPLCRHDDTQSRGCGPPHTHTLWSLKLWQIWKPSYERLSIIESPFGTSTLFGLERWLHQNALSTKTSPFDMSHVVPFYCHIVYLIPVYIQRTRTAQSPNTSMLFFTEFQYIGPSLKQTKSSNCSKYFILDSAPGFLSPYYLAMCLLLLLLFLTLSP